MSQALLSPFASRLAGRVAPLAPLAAAALLAGCGPDHPPGAVSSASGAPAASSAAAALSGAEAARASTAAPASPRSLSAAAPASAPTPTLAAACPKQPACPAPAPAAATPNPLAKPVGEKSRRLWAGHRAHTRHWGGHRGEVREAMLPPPPPLPPVDRYAGAYRLHEETREDLRAEAWRSGERRRVIVRRGEAYGGCPRACAGGYRDWDYAGIDARGYLVWRGKVEY